MRLANAGPVRSVNTRAKLEGALKSIPGIVGFMLCQLNPCVHAPEVCSAFSFDSDTLSVNPVGADPTVDASAVVANLESVGLSGFDEVNVLAAVHLAQDDITNLQFVRIRRHNGT